MFVCFVWAGTMDIFDVCACWLFALPKEASVMPSQLFSVYHCKKETFLLHWSYHHFYCGWSPSAGSSQLLNIQSQNSNFLTTVTVEFYVTHNNDTHNLRAIYCIKVILLLNYGEKKENEKYIQAETQRRIHSLLLPPCIFFLFFFRSYNLLNERFLMSCLLLLLCPPFH